MNPSLVVVDFFGLCEIVGFKGDDRIRLTRSDCEMPLIKEMRSWWDGRLELKRSKKEGRKRRDTLSLVPHRHV